MKIQSNISNFKAEIKQIFYSDCVIVYYEVKLLIFCVTTLGNKICA
jgi:hypothetical protein